MATIKRDRDKVAEIVRDAGGRIVGRTRLQRLAYLLELTGQGSGFDFEYRHYGPYSEVLTDAVRAATAFGLVTEKELPAAWGGRYSIFEIAGGAQHAPENDRTKFLKTAAAIGAIELELAATAAYLQVEEHCSNPWGETKRRKPEKAADGRLMKAKDAYKILQKMNTPKLFPYIADA